MQRHGDCFLIGGAERRGPMMDILEYFVDSSGGPAAVIGVVTAATSRPLLVYDDYSSLFRRLGVKLCRHILGSTRGHYATDTIDTLQRCTGVFLTGGSQGDLVRKLNSTLLREPLLHFHRRGQTLAGTSAGASALGCHMIVGDKGNSASESSIPRISLGLGRFSDRIIDQHFTERGRLPRLAKAVATLPGHIGIGIDENTGLWFRGGDARVIGTGRVTIVDANEHTMLQSNVWSRTLYEQLMTFPERTANPVCGRHR